MEPEPTIRLYQMVTCFSGSPSDSQSELTDCDMKEKMTTGVTSRNMNEEKEFASVSSETFGCFLSSLVWFEGLQFLGEFFPH